MKMRIGSMLVAAALMLTGCGSKGTSSSNQQTASGKTINLTMSAWGSPQELELYKKALNEYMKQNPNTKITFVPGNDGYEQKLLMQLSGKNAPDLFYAGDGLTAKLVSNQSVAPLNDFLNSDKSYVKAEEFAEGLWGPAKKDGKIYALTVDCNPMVMYYNKGLFKQLGIKTPQEYYEEGQWNWKTFKEVTTKLRDAGKTGFIQENWSGFMMTWIWSNAGKMYDEQGNVAYDNKAKEAIQFISNGIKDKTIAYAGSLPKGQGSDAMFMSGKAGLIAAGRWMVPMFSQNKNLEFDIIPWPTNTGNKIEAPAVPTAYLTVNKDSTNLEEAMRVASFYVSKQGQKIRLSGDGNAVPSVSGVDEIVTSSRVPEHTAYFIDGREKGYASGTLQYFEGQVPGLSGEIMNLYDLMLLDRAEADVTVENITKIANSMIKDYRAGK